ncbi:MAG: hypothetical protein H7Y31_02930 [Chitinophagaceae bacterium]|nr:hypothetical protein [Chitinophagaceae bacterium]
MMEEIIVDDTGELVEREKQSPFVETLAQIVSYVFHPLFITTYVTAFLLYIHPYVFAGFDPSLKLFRLFSILLNTTFIPGFAVFLMWRLRLIDSMHLKTTRERIIPYAAAIIFYFWAWLVFKRLPDSPAIFVQFLQGSFFGVCGAWIININSKVSMHTTAMGGLVTFFIIFSMTDDDASGLYLSLAILIAGLVASARLIVSDHTRFQIVQGVIVGALAQLVAWWL